MIVAVHRQTGSIHAALDNHTVSLCGLYNFSPHDKEITREYSQGLVTCQRCRSLTSHVRDSVVEPAGEGFIYMTTEVVRRLMGRSTVQSRNTHYTLDGDKSLCGVEVRYAPVRLLNKGSRDRPTCLKCLASPKVAEIFRSAEAEKRLQNRGKYDRAEYGHK